MLCQSSSNHVPSLTEQSPSLTVSRIELFIIPALAVDSAGHRVCLRLTSSLGLGWSELFISDTEEMIDMELSSDLLTTFIGQVSLPPLHDCQYDKENQTGRILELFAAAVHNVTPLTGDDDAAQQNTEEYVLRQRAVNYVSLF
ncbi:hypothetical protein D3C78_1102410 [compost metagenome]